MLLLGLRDWVSPLLSVTMGNGALVLAYIVWLAGTHRHYGARIRWHAWVATWAVAIAATTWYAYGEESFRARTAIVAGLCAAINIYHAIALLRHPKASRLGQSIGLTLTTGWLAALAAVYGVRALHAIVRPQGDSALLAQDAVQIVYTGSFTICNLMLVIGFATMASDYVRARIEEQAIRDPLTGTLNRKALLECLEREHSRSVRSRQAFSVAMVDVDHFKRINDGHGHPVGDRVLIHLCRRMQGLVRPHDMVARYGGEEFMIVMPDTPLPAALQAAERILSDAVKVDGPALPAFTISLGLAEWSEKDGSVEATVARADTALYAAKANGRNRVEIAAA
jgi:diguanylate cyclase (GGDEF)-like protein